MSRTLPDRLSAAAALTLRQGLHGYVWADRDLIATAKAGPLVDFVEVGKPISQSMVVLVGMGSDLHALLNAEIERGKPDPIIDLPNVTMETRGRLTPRLDLSILRDPEGRGLIFFISRVVGAADHDIEMQRLFRERLIAEEQLGVKSRALERANADLAEFAYVISHDLKAPLRAMRFLSDDIGSAIDTGDVAGARDAAEKLTRQTRRMGAMLTGLLEYASIGRKEDAVETVDMRALVDDIVSALKPAHSAFNFAVEGQWPTVATQSVPLDLVLRNLVENALKHHDRQQGTITLAAKAADGFVDFAVGDDGPGIPDTWQSAIFEPFTTVDDRDQPESSGIGLALVKKTVETIGGRISVSSQPDVKRGTTFNVRWPYQEAAPRSLRPALD